MDNGEQQIGSISFRLQRTTTEFAFVGVPMTFDQMVMQPDGTCGIDVDKITQRAIELGSESGVNWQLENQTIQPHPIQTPP